MWITWEPIDGQRNADVEPYLMKLLILRHGQAEAWAASDEQRALTETGRRDVARVVEAARPAFEGLEALWVSPYRRAQQTARIVIDTLQWPGSVTTVPDLQPDAALEPLYGLLQACKAQSVLLVSHQPLVGNLLDDLCGEDPGCYPMGTASLACLKLDVPARSLGQLEWLQHKGDV